MNLEIARQTMITPKIDLPTKKRPNGRGGVIFVGVEKEKTEKFLLMFGDMKTGQDAFKAFEDFRGKAI